MIVVSLLLKKNQMAVKKKKTIEWLMSKYSWFFDDFKLNEIEILDRFTQYKDKQSDSVEDFFWSILNYLLIESAKNAQEVVEYYNKSEKIYLVMVHFRRDYEKQPSNKLHKLWVENRMHLNIEQSNLDINFKISAGNDCIASKSIDGKIISKEIALKNETIPYDECSRVLGCTCMMIAIPKKDLNGRLVRKKE